jgi:hypothetical protein
LSTNGVGSQKYLKAKELGLETADPEEYIAVIQDDYRFATIDIVNDPSNIFGQIAQESRQDMTLEELKAKDPVAYAKLMAEAALEAAKVHPKPVDKAVDNNADIKALETRLIALEGENTALKQDKVLMLRKDIVTSALAEAKLPELGKSGDIDLDARFRKQLEIAALAAKTDGEAKTEVAEMIAERRALIGTGNITERNTPDIPSTTQPKKPDSDKAKAIASVRASVGLN